jgi:hypothetical protein
MKRKRGNKDVGGGLKLSAAKQKSSTDIAPVTVESFKPPAAPVSLVMTPSFAPSRLTDMTDGVKSVSAMADLRSVGDVSSSSSGGIVQIPSVALTANTDDRVTNTTTFYANPNTCVVLRRVLRPESTIFEMQATDVSLTSESKFSLRDLIQMNASPVSAAESDPVLRLHVGVYTEWCAETKSADSDEVVSARECGSSTVAVTPGDAGRQAICADTEGLVTDVVTVLPNNQIVYKDTAPHVFSPFHASDEDVNQVLALMRQLKVTPLDVAKADGHALDAYVSDEDIFFEDPILGYKEARRFPSFRCVFCDKKIRDGPYVKCQKCNRPLHVLPATEKSEFDHVIDNFEYFTRCGSVVNDTFICCKECGQAWLNEE